MLDGLTGRLSIPDAILHRLGLDGDRAERCRSDDGTEDEAIAELREDEALTGGTPARRSLPQNRHLRASSWILLSTIWAFLHDSTPRDCCSLRYRLLGRSVEPACCRTWMDLNRLPASADA